MIKIFNLLISYKLWGGAQALQHANFTELGVHFSSVRALNPAWLRINLRVQWLRD